MYSLIDTPAYKAHFSGHETFPLRQMWLKKAIDHAARAKSLNKKPFSEESAIAELGVGKNMVASIRHWSVACNVLNESSLEPELLGSTLFAEGGKDPYAEDISTIWLIHWQLAGIAKRSTTWYWLFNRVTSPTFKREDLIKPITEYAGQRLAKPLSPTSLKRDIEVCIRGYVAQSGSDSPEDAAEPMLAELDLITEVDKNIYAFRRGPKSTLADEIFAYALVDFWSRHSPDLPTLSFEAIAYGEGSPGRVFKMDEDSIAERLFKLHVLTADKLTWSDSAGVRQVFRKVLDLDTLKRSLLGQYYGV